MSASTADAWATIVGAMGAPAVGHLLALDEDVRTEDPPELLTEGQQRVVQELLELVTSGAGESDFAARMLVTEWLGEPHPGRDRSRSAQLRLEAGGTTDVPVSDDPVARPLMAMLRDVYAILLLPPQRPSSMAATGSLVRHPRRAEFSENFRADETLAKITPEYTEEEGWHGRYAGPGSRGSGVHLWTLPASLIQTAFDWARLHHHTPRLSDVDERLEQVVHLLRDAAAGRTVRVPVRVAFAGVRLPEGREIVDLGGGMTLRSRNRLDDWPRSQVGVSGRIVGQDPAGDMIEIDYAGDVVLETDMSYRIRLGHQPRVDRPHELAQSHTELEQRLENVRLALAMATQHGDVAVIAQAWQIAINPLSSAGPVVSWADQSSLHRLVPRRLTDTEVADWAEWAGRLQDADLSHVQIAIRRVLLALGQRLLPEDILIDSVMAWESLFGGAGDTTLRVCASLARVLAEPETRTADMVELKNLYGLRSRIVHGSTTLKAADAATPARALEIAVQALSVIVRDHPELLAERDSRVRSELVLLGSG